MLLESVFHWLFCTKFSSTLARNQAPRPTQTESAQAERVPGASWESKQAYCVIHQLLSCGLAVFADAWLSAGLRRSAPTYGKQQRIRGTLRHLLYFTFKHKNKRLTLTSRCIVVEWRWIWGKCLQTEDAWWQLHWHPADSGDPVHHTIKIALILYSPEAITVPHQII